MPDVRPIFPLALHAPPPPPVFFPPSPSSLSLSKANSTSMGQLDQLVSGGVPALTPESDDERSLPPQRVSTFRPRPYSMADTNKVRQSEGQRSVCVSTATRTHFPVTAEVAVNVVSSLPDFLRLCVPTSLTPQVTAQHLDLFHTYVEGFLLIVRRGRFQLQLRI